MLNNAVVEWAGSLLWPASTALTSFHGVFPMKKFLPFTLAVALFSLCFPAPGDENVIERWHLTPFWQGETMHGESLFFLEPAPGMAPEATLLFTPVNIVTLIHPASGATFEPGRDFIVDAHARRITLPPDSRIPSTTLATFQPPLGATGQKYRDGTRDIFFENEHRFHDLQVEITYTHDPGDWATMGGPVPEPATQHFPELMQKLEAGDPVSICLLGDSISFGLNASGVVGAAPHQPAYGTLFAKGLQARYGSPVDYTNFSISGMSTPWGLEQAPTVAAKKPDLVLIAFGMNDASGKLAPETFLTNVQAIVDRIKADYPPAAFVLVSTMRGNPEWIHASPELYPQYRDALMTAEGPGVAVADLTTMWTALLEHKKYADITGNGVNHPNDFGNRVYAQVLLSLFAARN